MREKERAEERQIGEAGDRPCCERRQVDGDRLASADDAQEIAGQAEGDDVGGEPGHHVVGAVENGDERDRQTDPGTAEEREEDADDVAAARPGANGCGKGAGEHHAFEADREHAGALGKDAAEGGEEERRRDPDGGGEEVSDHARRTVAASTNSIVSPSMTVTRAEGTPI